MLKKIAVTVLSLGLAVCFSSAMASAHSTARSDVSHSASQLRMGMSSDTFHAKQMGNDRQNQQSQPQGKKKSSEQQFCLTC